MRRERGAINWIIVLLVAILLAVLFGLFLDVDFSEENGRNIAPITTLI